MPRQTSPEIDPPESPCPFDLGLTLDVWQEEDFDGFMEELTEVFDDHYLDLWNNRYTFGTFAGMTSLATVEEAMDKRLAALALVMPEWLKTWMGRMTGEIGDD